MKKASTIEDHLINKPVWIIDLYKKLKINILKLDKVVEVPTGPYIGYKFITADNKAKLFVEIHLQLKKIELHLRPLDYNDPENKTFNYNYIPKWSLRKGIKILNENDLNYSLSLIKASYNDIS